LFLPQFLSENRFTLSGNCSKRWKVDFYVTCTLSSLGLLSSEPDPVGEWHTHKANFPSLYRQSGTKKQGDRLLEHKILLRPEF